MEDGVLSVVKGSADLVGAAGVQAHDQELRQPLLILGGKNFLKEAFTLKLET